MVSNWHWEVLETVIESAFISSAGLVALLSTYLVDSNAMYICMEAVQPLIVRHFRSVAVYKLMQIL